MKSVLIVDDIAENLYFLEVLLRGNGFEVRSASNGAEALQSARTSAPDLILSDILMPVMDGYALCRECKADERLKKIPFIFYTATFIDRKDEELALSLGADWFIIKPMDPEALMNIIREVLDKYRGAAPPVLPDSTGNESELLKAHNEALLRKLEKKMADLELANEQEKLATMRLQQLNNELEERVRLRTRELEAKVAELDAFASVVSHDLRAPMRQVYSYSQILNERLGNKLEAEDEKILQRIVRISTGATKMVDALLELLRLGNAKLVLDEVNLSVMTEDILSELSAAEPDRCHQFDLTPGLRVTADRHLLRIVLTNLLGNSWKFCTKQQKTVISLMAMPGDDDQIFCIRDNGAGFEMQYADKLFIPFQRLHLQEEFVGNGIGLATVNNIIRLHGGRIWAESEPYKGACFYFTLGTDKVIAGT